MPIDATITRTDDGWRATLDALQGLAPSIADAATPEDALDAAREAAFVAVDRELRARGVEVTAPVLVGLELKLRQAVTHTLAALDVEPLTYVAVRPWGNDVSTFPDLDPTFTLLDSRRIVAEAVARRLTTPRGSLVDNPLYGFDVRTLLHASASPAQRASWEQQIEAQAIADERVQAAQVSLVKQDRGWRVGVRLVTADGPFRLVVSVNDVRAALLLDEDA